MRILLVAVELTAGTSLYMSKRKDDVPRNAIKSGLSPCGNVYVGIAFFEDEIMPAKIIQAYNLTYFSYKGKEYSSPEKMVSVSRRIQLENTGLSADSVGEIMTKLLRI